MAESYSRSGIAEMPMPKRSNKPPKVMEHMRIMPAENGGVSVEHHFTHYDHKPEMHVFGAGDGKKFVAHVMKHSGMKDTEEAEDAGDKEEEGNEPEA